MWVIVKDGILEQYSENRISEIALDEEGNELSHSDFEVNIEFSTFNESAWDWSSNPPVNISQTPEYIAEQAQKERERIDNLTIPRTDLFKAIYLSKGLTPETIRSTIESIEDEQTRVIALIDFDNAKTFYRKHNLFSDFALSLGFTSIDIDNIFIQANNLT